MHRGILLSLGKATSLNVAFVGEPELLQPGVGEQRLSPSKALLALETNLAITAMWLEKAWPDETENTAGRGGESRDPTGILPPGQGKPRNAGAGGSSSGAVP